jgi:hypothetical protein
MTAVPTLQAQTRVFDVDTRPLISDRAGKAWQLLSLGVDLGAGYDNDVLRADDSADNVLPSPIGQQRVERSTFEQGAANLRYRLGASRFTLAADATTVAVFYPILQSPLMWNHGGLASATYRLGRGTKVLGLERVSYQPYYSFLPPLAGLASFDLQTISSFDLAFASALPDQSVSAVVENHLSNTSTVELRQRLTRRFELWLDYEDDRSQSPSHLRDVTTEGGSAHIVGPIGKGLGLRVGYGYATSRYGVGADEKIFRRQNEDLGLTFTHAISLSRHTTLAFDTGSSTFSEAGQTHFFLTGTAVLRREINRTWVADLTFNRNVQFLETFHDPVSANALGARADGKLSRRVALNLGAVATAGRVGFNAVDNTYASYQATSSLSMSLTRVLGAAINYSYLHYRFGAGVGLPEAVRLHADRQRVSVTGTFRAPLFRRRGRSDVTE